MPGRQSHSSFAARPAWIWPLAVPRRIATRSHRGAEWLARVALRRHLWLPWAALAGFAPIAVAYLFGLPGQHAVSALLVAPLLVAAVARDSMLLGAGALGVAFLSHNTIAIWLAAIDPEGLAAIFPAGADYWDRSHHWIMTGERPEYDVSWWLPAHAQLLGGVALFTYTSLGLITLWQGFYEVDLMNFYVGRLMAHSESGWLALLLGWHPWSLCRGLGYLVITFEVASYSFQRLTGVTLSTPARRLRRWCGGLGLLGLDVLIKLSSLDLVRGILYANLS